MLRRLVIVLGVLAGLLALADRGLAVFAGNAVAAAVQKSEGLSERPEVSFRGFPFVTQAVRGRFRQVDVSVRDYRREQLTITRIDASLRGVEVGLSKALSGEVSAVPVDQGSAEVRLGYADLNEFLRTRPGDPRVDSGGQGRLRVRADVAVPNAGTVVAEGRATITVQNGMVRVRVVDVSAAGGAALPSAVRTQAQSRLSFDVSLAELPFGIRVTGVSVEADALVVAASAEGIVISA